MTAHNDHGVRIRVDTEDRLQIIDETGLLWSGMSFTPAQVVEALVDAGYSRELAEKLRDQAEWDLVAIGYPGAGGDEE